jgi:hypothetical protein
MYTLTNPSEYYVGKSNPLERKIVHKILNVDTRFRDNYYSTSSTDYILDLPFKLSNVVSMQLLDIKIPSTFFNIRDDIGNNSFLIRIDTTYETRKIVVPDGYYTNDGLIDWLNKKMTELGGDFADIYFFINKKSLTGTGETVVGLKDTTSLLFNFTLEFYSDLIEDIYKQKTSIELNKKLGWLLGFRYNTYSEKLLYVSEGMNNLNCANPYFLLYIDEYNNNLLTQKFISINNKSMLQTNILAKIENNNLEFNYNTGYYLNEERTYFGPINIEKMHIKLLNCYGEKVDLNNDDFSFTLLFKVLY